MKKRIILGITGSIAAFKALQLISALVKEDYEIDVLMSEAGSRMVTPASVMALTKRRVYIDVFDDEPGRITHVDIVKGADLFMIVPASANTIAKLANGMADNMLTSAWLAATCPKMIAPAMNTHMYQNIVTQRNLKTLENDGVLIVSPDSGWLACGDTGTGKLADLPAIRLMMDYAMSAHPLQGKKVLVTAGPTQEALDPVRYLTNHSSGKMGYAIARAAYIMGADVTIVSGPVNLTLPGVNIVPVVSAQDLFDAVTSRHEGTDIFVLAAAVGDFRPATKADQKIKKTGDELTVTFTKNPDTLAWLGAHKKDGQVLVGFAMETENTEQNARGKLEKKNADMIIANNLFTPGAGFKTDTNVATMITKDKTEPLEKMTKEALGTIILEKCLELEDKAC